MDGSSGPERREAAERLLAKRQRLTTEGAGCVPGRILEKASNLMGYALDFAWP